jgi:Mrp family chromosome partitioning ATPase
LRQFASLAAHVRKLGRGVVAVAPAQADEPAGPVALDLARELAHDGGRVAMLDLDVAKKFISGQVGDRQAPGLADLLFGVAHFSEVIQRDRASRVHIIPVGRGIRDMAAMLAGERLSIVLGALSQTYDHVLLATPALPSVPGVSRLARFAAGVLLVTIEGEEGSAAAASDALAAQGFCHVAVVSVGPDLGSPERAPDQAAA